MVWNEKVTDYVGVDGRYYFQAGSICLAGEYHFSWALRQPWKHWPFPMFILNVIRPHGLLTPMYFLLTQDFGDCRIKLGWHWMISILRAMYHNVSLVHPSCSVWSFFPLSFYFCLCVSVCGVCLWFPGLEEASILHQFIPGDMATPFGPRSEIGFTSSHLCSITRDPCTVPIPAG